MIVESPNGPRPISKLSRRWARRLEWRKELKASKQLEANAIEEAITQAMLDSGASKTFVNSRRGMQRTGLSDKVVVTADGTEHPASHTVLLPTKALSKGAREAIVVPGMQQKALLSVGTLANNGYTTVFLPGQQGVRVLEGDSSNTTDEKTVLQGWREDGGSRLWRIEYINDKDARKGACQRSFMSVTTENAYKEVAVTEVAGSVYDLPSTEQAIRWMHAVWGYPVKSTWLKATQAGNFISWPLLTNKNINK